MLSDTVIWNSLRRSKQLTLIAGPCVIETEELCFEVAASLRKTCRRLGLNYIFKASYDKANRSSGQSFRGPGLAAGSGRRGRPAGGLNGDLDDRVGDARERAQAPLDFILQLLRHLRVVGRDGERDVRDAPLKAGRLDEAERDDVPAESGVFHLSELLD